MTDAKAAQLSRIAHDIEHCKICKIGKSGKAVPGEGNCDADIMFVGEAPGKNEAQTGRPFIGRSGKYLRTLIEQAGIKPEVCFITSPVKYLPDRGTPTQKDIDHGKIHLDQQIAIIDPKIIVLMGSVACKAVLGEPKHVMKDHGTVITKGSRRYMITIHPAAVLRFRKNAVVMEEDFRKLRRLVG